MNDSIVYVIDGGNGFYKIGSTSNLESRLRTLQASSPCPLTVVMQGPGSFHLERALHRQFAHRRAHGEWFELTKPDLKELRRRLNGGWVVVQLPKAQKVYGRWKTKGTVIYRMPER